MNNYTTEKRVHNLVDRPLKGRAPCGQCTTCLDKAVRQVFETKSTTPDACRHLWAVLSACVIKNGWNATQAKFEALACRHFKNDAKTMVGEAVQMLMSNISIAEAA